MLKTFILFSIKVYQKLFSFDHGIPAQLFPNSAFCRYTPTCSQFGYEAVERYGAFKGGWLAFKRVLRCHPWTKHEHYDPVP